MPDTTKNTEVSKYFTFNQTGNIMVSSTVQQEKELRDEVITEFQKVAVLYDAISTAIARKKRPVKAGTQTVHLGLFDYESISAIIGRCGFFALMHEEDRTFEKQSSSLSINTALITEVLGAVELGGPVMEAAKTVIGSMGGKAKSFDLSHSEQHKNVRIGHLLFICEDCMGMPLISVQVISTSLDQLAWVVRSPCSSATHDKITMTYKMETFMFVDPRAIAEFSHEFKASDDFEDLISRLTDLVPDDQIEPKKPVQQNQDKQKNAA